MIAKPFDDIAKADIEALVAQGQPERRTMEYKEALQVLDDKGKKEFLADVSSFANAAGGDLIFGVVDKREDGKPTGIPESAPGLAGLSNADPTILQLEQIIRANIDPRIPGVRVKAIGGFNDGPVLLLRVPKSYASPHMIKLADSGRFYSRTSNGKYILDVREIRSAFALSESVPERIRDLRGERLAQIVADETPVRLPPNPKLLLHIVPFGAFAHDATVDLALAHERFREMPPIDSATNFGCRFNLDGLMTYGAPQEGFSNSYTQLFRNGVIEAVNASLVTEYSGEKRVAHVLVEQALITSLDCYLTFQQNLGMLPPFVILLTAVGIKGYKMAPPRGASFIRTHTIDRDTLILPDVLVQETGVGPPTILRPVFDALWQAAGWPGSQNYDKNGKWTGM